MLFTQDNEKIITIWKYISYNGLNELLLTITKQGIIMINYTNKILILLLIASFALLFTSACSDDDNDTEVTGNVTGVITAPNGTTAVPGATVGLASPASDGARMFRPLDSILDATAVIDPDGPTTVTNANGEFTLEGVPVGEQMLAAKAGVFEITFSVEVSEGETTDSGTSAVQATRKLGYVNGSFDSMEDIVEDLGAEIERIDRTDLDDIALLTEYDMIFVNCGASAYSSARAEALTDYVMSGGTLYVSDLEYRLVEEIFPGEISFGNGGSQTVQALIEDELLQQYVQDTSLEITYNLGGWRRVSDLELTSNTRELLTGSVQEIEDDEMEPLAFTFRLGNGRVVYTTFHNTASASEDQRQVLSYYVLFPDTDIN